MEILISFIIVYVVVYLFYLFFVILRKSKLSRIKQSSEALLIKKKYNLKLNNITDKKLANIIAFSNAFIIAITFVIMEFVKNFILKIMIAFIVLIVLILSIYLSIGKYLKKKEGK